MRCRSCAGFAQQVGQGRAGARYAQVNSAASRADYLDGLGNLAPVGFAELVEVVFGSADELPQPGDLFVGGHGLLNHDTEALAVLLPDGLPEPSRELIASLASLTVLSAKVAAWAEGIAEGEYLDRIIRL